MKKRVVITGWGLITPFGVGVENNWNKLLQEKSCIKTLSTVNTSNLRVKIGGEIPKINFLDHLPGIRPRRLDESVLLTLLASKEAIQHAKLTEKECKETGMILGTCFGTIKTKEDTFLRLAEDESSIYALIFLKGMDNAAANETAIRFKLKGINQTIFTACSASLMAIGNAYRQISDGHEKRIITGGVDSAITKSVMKGWEKLHVISFCKEPDSASRPFSKNRDGLVMSEGAGFVVLEEYETAIKRKATIYGEIAGFGTNCDATHITSPDVESQSAAMHLALKDAGVSPSQIQYINAHGTATTFNDKAETQAFKNVFGEYAYKIPVSATKSQIGHTMGACGAIEMILTLLMMKHKTLLPTLHFEGNDPDCDLDYVPNKIRKVNSVDYALKTSFGFGGSNAVVVLKNEFS